MLLFGSASVLPSELNRKLNQKSHQCHRTDSVCLILRHFKDNFCFFALFALISHRCSCHHPCGCVVWVTRHIERRLLRFVLTPWNLAVSITNVKNNAIVNAPWLYYIYSPHCVKAIGVSLHQWQLWAQSGCWYIPTAWVILIVVLLLDIRACQSLKE